MEHWNRQDRRTETFYVYNDYIMEDPEDTSPLLNYVRFTMLSRLHYNYESFTILLIIVVVVVVVTYFFSFNPDYRLEMLKWHVVGTGNEKDLR